MSKENYFAGMTETEYHTAWADATKHFNHTVQSKFRILWRLYYWGKSLA